MEKVVVVSGSRTAVGAFGGSLKDVAVVDLGAAVIRETLCRAGVRPVPPRDYADTVPQKLSGRQQVDIEKECGRYDSSLCELVIDEVIMGNVLQSGQGQNTARQAMIRAGIAKETPAFTINKVCGSGLKAIALGAQSIMTGQADVIVAGGQENMSRVPMALMKGRWGHRMEVSGIGEVHDLLVYDALYEIFYGYHMGVTAENIARLYQISREDQDRLALISHDRALAAIDSGLFNDEIVPVSFMSRNKEVIVDRDERPMQTSMEKLANLRPVFDRNGSVTAGNASGINDGAAAVLLMSETKALELDLKPLAVIEGFASGGLDPAYMGLGPVPAIRRALSLAKMELDDIELIELNEAFAAQAIGCMLELGIDIEKPNRCGSGISMGHPVGCTGARQMVTALNQIEKNGYGTGLISMCIGGGMGMAMVVTNPN
ncbi:thiolase family protein [Desulforhopalus singaporensis]|uniref:Acetyl-CoA acetyltransferase n=1 Tax=Desulforhopalus singaporensis TaxID=91360 RepID=A0A1H0Q4F7_9BACT|nr:acetyl-CoA C-acetyltransferase [Desulforhopalus singaporensis]SDP12297.1 acetyl-CoA acetyltransferase [Desulforhopalus singaporensis]